MLEGKDAARAVHTQGVSQHLLVFVLGGGAGGASCFCAASATAIFFGEVQVGQVQIDGGSGGDEAIHLRAKGVQWMGTWMGMPVERLLDYLVPACCSAEENVWWWIGENDTSRSGQTWSQEPDVGARGSDVVGGA